MSNLVSELLEHSSSENEIEDGLDRDHFLMKTQPINTEFLRTALNPHTSSFKKVSLRKSSKSGLKVDYDSEATGVRKTVSNKRKISSIRDEGKNESHLKGRTFTATHKQASNQIPLIVNRRESANRMFYIRCLLYHI